MDSCDGSDKRLPVLRMREMGRLKTGSSYCGTCACDRCCCCCCCSRSSRRAVVVFGLVFVIVAVVGGSCCAWEAPTLALAFECVLAVEKPARANATGQISLAFDVRGRGKREREKKKRQPRPRAKQFISLAIVDMIDSLRTHAPSACACVCTLQSNDTCNSPRRRQLWRLALVLYQACCVACRAVPYGWMSYYVYSSLDVSGLIIPGGGDKRPYAIGSVCSLLYNPSSPSARCCFLGLAAVCWRKRCTLSSAKPCAQIYGPCKWVCLFR